MNRRSRVGVLGLAAAGLLTVSPGFARTESSPRLYMSGQTVILPGIGTNIRLPDAPAGWAVSATTESFAIDILRRQDPTNPALTIELHLEAGDCRSAFTGGIRTIENSPFAPPNWEPSAQLLTEGTTRTHQLCTPVSRGGVLHATVKYEAPRDADPGIVRPLLEEAGRALGGRRTGSGAISGVGTVSGTMLRLEVVGISIPKPGPEWTYLTHSDKAGDRFDTLSRNSPTVALIFRRITDPCALKSDGEYSLVNNPVYWAAGFQSSSTETSKGGARVGILCMPVTGGSVLAAVSVVPAESFDAEAAAAQPFFAAVANALTASGSRSDGGTARPDTDSSKADDYYVPTGSKTRDVWGSLDLGVGTFLYPDTTDAAGNPSPKPDSSYTGYGSFEALGSTASRSNVFGYALRLGGHLGIGSSQFAYDFNFGMGLGLQLGSVLHLAGIVGLGVDGHLGTLQCGGQPCGDSRGFVESAGYYSYGTELYLSPVRAFRVAAGINFLRRAGKEQETFEAYNSERRIFGRIFFGKYSLGMRFTQWSKEEPSGKKSFDQILGTFGWSL